MLGTFSRKLSQLPGLTALVGEPVVHLRRARDIERQEIRAIVGWGLRPTTHKPRQIGQRRGLPFLALEDGFLRAFGTGATHPSLSLVVDRDGIYYDGTRPSSLESLLASSTDVLTGIGADYQQARDLIIRHGLSKYNAAPDTLPPELARAGKRVLVIDQTRGDASIEYGLASPESFQAMVALARREHPDATLFIKTHPEVSRGDKMGYLSAWRGDERCVLLRQPVNPIRLLESVDHVYTVTSHMGFEALLLGKPVTCMGLPWYAGWGVTNDQVACARRQRRRSVDELFAAAYLHYTRYLDPETHERGNIFDVIKWLARQRAFQAAEQGRSIAVGFRRWKAYNVAPFLALDARRAKFVPHASAAARLRPGDTDRLIVWGANPPEAVRELARASGARLALMEDGFIRSVGLGSDFVPAQALVFDEQGLYFDARQPSSLEILLNTRRFTQDDLARARVTRALIVDHQLTKYNIEPTEPPGWRPLGKRVVLVPGQVEDDASILYGCGGIRTNLALLQAVRAARPNAFIVYKPHPDVMVRNRKGRLHQADALRYADVIETKVSIVNCVSACDEVHTMTSLSGFEGLLRGKPVVTYGAPFYAGWGLTEDRLIIPRRDRSLTLDELVAGALLHYPTYWDWTLKGYTTCEAALRHIIRQRDLLTTSNRLNTVRKTYLQRQWHKVKLWARAGFLVKR
ncbi:capsular polysaccharide biosynthesis protein [Bordetella hinzii]|uniref:capsular polysaccharide biosynthesis protein n=1 Tax=Bordetella hinzii TaxID=103855 RepID=UPI0011508B61|nr:capsular polysaccharide biosynthesis protein [Bordetella hinzii]QDJ46582.1 beta-3-deoxy-D-manno-oct-2-ulosonic acid transferase [Bordetella hinzii]QWF41992.1 capsular polysaccharide biosynthesis protein [Bordetella hinzii]QWF46534.1 capsular polysaccharide biosynthesis protein [Bordetella hinzii]QWF56043.1 capsular polysaccharide biosynthesis protein [Bordetella hinzii]